MAFAVAQPASFADPVIVLLSDGSIRLYHEQLMQVRDVLREFPHHGLASLNHIAASGAGAPPDLATSGYCYATSRQSQPPNVAPLPPERFLRPGGTYCLVEHPVLAAHVALSVNHARRPHDLASCAAECTASDAENMIDDSESPSDDATVVSCFTPRASRTSTRQRAAVAAKGGSGLERAASMPPINHSLRAALMMPTTPRKPTTGAAIGAVALPSSPSAAAAAATPATTLPPLARTTSGTVPSTAPTIPNSVSQRARPSSAASPLISPRAPPASASALISPRAPPSSASALISPRAPPASASSLVSPRALLSSGSRKLARALTALPRPRRNASRERDGTERSRVPRDVSNHGASGPWSLMDLVSPKGAASASRAENHTVAQLGAYAISAEDMYSWENAIRDLKISRGEREEEGEAESSERQRNRGVRYFSGRNEARQANWSGGLTPRGLPLLSPVETASECDDGTQQQGRNAADSVQSTQSTGSTGYMFRVSSQGSLGMARSSPESSESSCSGGGGSSWRASRTNIAGSSCGSINASTSSSVSSSSKGRLQAASHRLSLFKSLRLHVARPSAAAVLGVHTAEKAAAVEATHADGLSRSTPSLTNGGLSPSAAKLACAAGPGEGGSEEISLGASAHCVAASSDSSSSDLTQMKDWFSRNVASAPNTPLPVMPRDAPTPKLVNNLGFVAAGSGSTLAGPSMRMHGVNASAYVVEPFPVTPLHAIS